ncbi:MAG: hypothetical protein HYV07_20015 [Deltaproteobacteria bacterium]|nr:hypothetical protein [Deltaproteobacteria bacterium]
MKKRPEPVELAFALRLRYQLDPAIKIDVLLGGTKGAPETTVKIEAPGRGGRAQGGRELYVLKIGFERWSVAPSGERARDEFEATNEAADALVGQLVESGFAYRELPGGSGVAHAEGLFSVLVEHEKPDLEAWADELLGAN